MSSSSRGLAAASDAEGNGAAGEPHAAGTAAGLCARIVQSGFLAGEDAAGEAVVLERQPAAGLIAAHQETQAIGDRGDAVGGGPAQRAAADLVARRAVFGDVLLGNTSGSWSAIIGECSWLSSKVHDAMCTSHPEARSRGICFRLGTRPRSIKSA